jgi:hypothetical protein
MGTVDISAAIESPEFRAWFAEESLKPLGNSRQERLARLSALYQLIVDKLKGDSKRTPHVKIFRVLAALYPQYFSTITNKHMALSLHRALYGKIKKPDVVRRQLEIRERLDSVQGASDGSFKSLASRMAMAWFVFEDYVHAPAESEEAEIIDQSGVLTLKPLPAVQRRKGFTSIKGGLGTISNALRFVEDVGSRDDLMDYLRAEFPDYRESSLRTLVNILKNEFYVIKEEGGVFSPTDRGEAFLDSGDPQDLIPQFLTRTLGVDHILLALTEGPRTARELVSLLKKVNPGWTTEFAPRAMLKWLRDFDLVEIDAEGAYRLTESGQDWAKAIHWTPEFLVAAESVEVDEPPSPDAELDIGRVDHSALMKQVGQGLAMDAALVSQLHLGLWSHKRRHFAILAGLSGSGKTLLAQRYAQVLAAQFTENPEKNVFVQAVQPGWFDPAPLFGYVNPLVPENYVRPALLDFLLLAARNPDQPFTVILDEMNLSHPEQYFAPVLSAMETGTRLRLHNEGDTFDGVPSTIEYPENVAFIGTVNMDETTHGISDKVLDRAFTLEFWDINLDDYPRWGAHGLSDADLSRVKSVLGDLLQALHPERMHFGWRTVEDVLSYLGMASGTPGFDLATSLDDVLYARVLPKLRGTESTRLHDALQGTIQVLDQAGLGRSAAKARSLKSDLTDTGMMRFWR